VNALVLFIIDHWGAISSSLSGWLMTAYLHISHAGGLRTIWSNILGPKQPVNGGSDNNQTNKQ
jgi:hypothetical protein